MIRKADPRVEKTDRKNDGPGPVSLHRKNTPHRSLSGSLKTTVI